MDHRRLLPKAALAVAFFLLMSGTSRAAPIHDAAESGDLKKVQELLMTHPDWVDVLDEEGETPLLEAAEEGHLEVVLLLLERGANLNHQDRDGETALMEAAGESRVDCVNLLLRKGAGLGALDNDGRSVLQRTTNESIIQLLRSRGAR